MQLVRFSHFRLWRSGLNGQLQRGQLSCLVVPQLLCVQNHSNIPRLCRPVLASHIASTSGSSKIELRIVWQRRARHESLPPRESLVTSRTPRHPVLKSHHSRQHGKPDAPNRRIGALPCHRAWTLCAVTAWLAADYISHRDLSGLTGRTLSLLRLHKPTISQFLTH